MMRGRQAMMLLLLLLLQARSEGIVVADDATVGAASPHC